VELSDYVKYYTSIHQTMFLFYFSPIVRLIIHIASFYLYCLLGQVLQQHGEGTRAMGGADGSWPCQRGSSLA